MCADPPDTPARAALTVPSQATADGLELGGGLVPRGNAGLGRLQLRTGATREAPSRSDARVTSGIRETYVSASDRGYGDGTAGSASGISRRGRPSGGNKLLDLLNSGVGNTILAKALGKNLGAARKSNTAAKTSTSPAASAPVNPGVTAPTGAPAGETSTGLVTETRPYVNPALRLL